MAGLGRKHGRAGRKARGWAQCKGRGMNTPVTQRTRERGKELEGLWTGLPGCLSPLCQPASRDGS